ncbi:MAG: ATP-binding cassette domain-containing protein [Bacteroidetes bacterium]|nr:ATP-binding cassette domain-containing protein [Bacteroidota bacterium]
MSTYKRVLAYIKPFWKHLSASVLFTIGYAVLNGVSIYMIIPLLDTLFQGNGTQTQIKTVSPSISAPVTNWFSQTFDDIIGIVKGYIFSGDTQSILLKICILIIILFFLKNVFGYLQAYFLAFVEQGMIRNLRNEAYMHLHRLPMSFFKNEKTGNLISRIMNDVNVVQASVSAVFLNLIREPLTILVFLGIAVSISWRLTLFSLLVLPFSIGIISWIGLILRKQSGLLQQEMADITTTLHETITGVKIVKAFGMENYENKKFKAQTQKFFRLVLKITRIRNTASPVTEFLSVVVGGAMIYFGGQLVLFDKTLKPSEFLVFLMAIFQMMPPIKELSSVNNRIQESSAAADRVFEILDTEPRIKNVENPLPLNDFNDTIEFQNVSFHYDDSEELVLDTINLKVKKGNVIAIVGSSGAGKTTMVDLLPRFYDPTKFQNVSFHYDDSEELVLDTINLKVKKGNVIAIVGSSGAGKTTMVDLLPRFYDPTSGKVLFDGTDIKSARLEDLRKLMGIVTQETVLFNESVKSNIAYGIDDCAEQKLFDAAKAANAHNFIMELPHGYETIIGEKGTKLSGGQRQRLAIARALLKNPPIMILDEATSALDNESEVLVQEAIERLMHDRTTFVIAHRLSTIRNADRIIVLDRGRIVQDGKHDQLLNQENGIYKKLYELQFRV